MSDYFKCVGTKASVENKKTFDTERLRYDLLMGYLGSRPDPIEVHWKEIDSQYFVKWFNLLFCNYNVVVRGPLSKYRLLETFVSVYLESGRLPNLKAPRGFLDVVPVKLHGFEPPTFEAFKLKMFNIADSKKLTDEIISDFIQQASYHRKHYIFIIHSFESFYFAREDICELIFQLYEREPEFMHILTSSDHINGGALFARRKVPFQLVFFDYKYGESFFFERAHIQGLSLDVDAMNGDQIFTSETQLNLNSIKDVYQAMQKACQEILVYIVKDYISQAQLIETEREQEAEAGQTRLGTGAKNIRRSTRIARKTSEVNDLDINRLMSYCASNFIATRQNVLRNHLGELIDHKIIELDATGNRIKCLVSLETCKKFLDYIGQR